MKILFESDREVTIDTVGLLKPFSPVEVDSQAFERFHGVKPTKANLPSFIKVLIDMSDGDGR